MDVVGEIIDLRSCVVVVVVVMTAFLSLSSSLMLVFPPGFLGLEVMMTFWRDEASVECLHAASLLLADFMRTS